MKTGQEALDYYYLHKGSEQSESQDGEKIKQVNDKENEKKAKTKGEERENTDSSTVVSVMIQKTTQPLGKWFIIRSVSAIRKISKEAMSG